MTQAGNNYVTLGGLNTFSGLTTITSGTLDLANSNALTYSTLVAPPAGTGSLEFDQSVTSNAFTLGGLSGSGDLILLNNALLQKGVTLSVGTNNASTTYSGVLSGFGSLTKVGSGMLTLVIPRCVYGPNQRQRRHTPRPGQRRRGVASQHTCRPTSGSLLFDQSVASDVFTLGRIERFGDSRLAKQRLHSGRRHRGCGRETTATQLSPACSPARAA